MPEPSSNNSTVYTSRYTSWQESVPRLLDAAGTAVAQHDSWPANGLLPTSQWRIEDYIQDSHTLLVANTQNAEYQLTVVVYHNETQAVLAGPITFASVRLK